MKSLYGHMTMLDYMGITRHVNSALRGKEHGIIRPKIIGYLGDTQAVDVT